MGEQKEDTVEDGVVDYGEVVVVDTIVDGGMEEVVVVVVDTVVGMEEIVVVDGGSSWGQEVACSCDVVDLVLQQIEHR